MELLTNNIKHEAIASKFTFTTDLPATPIVFKDSDSDPRKGDGKKRIRLTASTSATDLVGDVMSTKALERMKSAAPGTTIFLNHEADVPYSVFGAVESAELITRTFRVTDGNKTIPIKVLCLDYDVIVEESNQPAVDTYNIIVGGIVKLGASITIAIVDKTNLSDGRRQIDDVVYLETSIVGIPCNQTAWVQAVKSTSWLHKAYGAIAEAIGMVVEEESSVTAASLSSVNKRTIAAGVIAPEQALERTSKTVMANDDNNKITISKAANLAQASAVIKDLFTEALNDVLSNPWFYVYRFEDALMELLWWNDSMPAAEKVAALQEMCDAFKAKMVEVCGALFSEEDAEKSATLKKEFSAAIAKHLSVWSKEGRRNSKDDQETIQKMHDMCNDLGAECDDDEDSEDAELEEKSLIVAGKEVKFTLKNMKPLEEAIAAISAASDVEGELQTASENQTLLAKQVTDLTAERDTLAAANKGLEKEVLKWKALANTAASISEEFLAKPAPRNSLISTANN